MKTVTAISADGRHKKRVRIEEQAGAFCIARARLFAPGKRCWVIGDAPVTKEYWVQCENKGCDVATKAQANARNASVLWNNRV